MELNYLPSFCTACYRSNRTGDRFMKLAKTGQISNCCHPNALITLKEYIEEYASTETRTKGEQLIQEELINISNMDIRKKTEEFLSSEFKGRRDFRF